MLFKKSRKIPGWKFSDRPNTRTIVEKDAWFDRHDLDWVTREHNGDWVFYSDSQQDELAPDAYLVVCLADTVTKWPQVEALHVLKRGQGAVWRKDQGVWELISLDADE